jgi:hypothetical protein
LGAFFTVFLKNSDLYVTLLTMFSQKGEEKMDFTVLTNNFEMVVVVACLIVGYTIKTAMDFVPNKYIPTILACVGLALNMVVNGISVENIVYGALMGLASTGMHQAFTQFINKE